MIYYELQYYGYCGTKATKFNTEENARNSAIAKCAYYGTKTLYKVELVANEEGELNEVKTEIAKI